MNRTGGWRVRIERKPQNVRVQDFVLKSVGFVAEMTRSDGHADELDREATGFFVTIPSTRQTGTSYAMFGERPET